MNLDLGISDIMIERCLESAFSFVFFNKKSGKSNPTCFILGGQPASGKSSLINQIVKSNNDIVVINGDEFRDLHPQYQIYLKEDSRSASDKTQLFINYVVERCIEKAIIGRYDILIEGTMRNPDVPVETAKYLKTNGYRCEAHVLAASPSKTELRIFLRYINQKNTFGTGRFTPLDSHTAACEGLLVSVDRLCSEQQVDLLVVYTEFAAKKIAEFIPPISKNPSDFILQERNRNWTDNETVEYMMGWETVYKVLNDDAEHGEFVRKRYLEKVKNRIQIKP